jgi:hypothetical protein
MHMAVAWVRQAAVRGLARDGAWAGWRAGGARWRRALTTADTPDGPLAAYGAQVATGRLRPDPSQAAAARALQAFHVRIHALDDGSNSSSSSTSNSGTADDSDSWTRYLVRWFSGGDATARRREGLGIYLYGGPGTGKTHLMVRLHVPLPWAPCTDGRVAYRTCCTRASRPGHASAARTFTPLCSTSMIACTACARAAARPRATLFQRSRASWRTAPPSCALTSFRSARTPQACRRDPPASR